MADYQVNLPATNELMPARETSCEISSPLEDLDGTGELERLASVGRAAGSIAHDLRHMLMGVVGCTELLATGRISGSEHQRMCLGFERTVRSMTGLLDSLVELARAPGTLHPEFVSVRGILWQASLTVRSDPRFQHVAFVVDCDRDLRAWLDPRLVERALFNLLLNACEAVPEQSGKIEVCAVETDSTIDIRVSDNGPGIPESIRPKVFEQCMTFGKRKGVGLGLAVVQKCCCEHRGKLILENSSVGATFRLLLPVREPGD